VVGGQAAALASGVEASSTCSISSSADLWDSNPLTPAEDAVLLAAMITLPNTVALVASASATSAAGGGSSSPPFSSSSAAEAAADDGAAVGTTTTPAAGTVVVLVFSPIRHQEIRQSLVYTSHTDSL
jgi:hypothetical protein